MSDTVLERRDAHSPETELGIVDCDIHPYMSTPGELGAFLPERWRKHLAEYGARRRNRSSAPCPMRA